MCRRCWSATHEPAPARHPPPDVAPGPRRAGRRMGRLVAVAGPVRNPPHRSQIGHLDGKGPSAGRDGAVEGRRLDRRQHFRQQGGLRRRRQGTGPQAKAVEAGGDLNE